MVPSHRIARFLHKSWDEKVHDRSIFRPQEPGENTVPPCARSDEDVAER